MVVYIKVMINDSIDSNDHDVSINLDSSHLIDGNSQHTISISESNGKNVSAQSRNDDSARQEYI